MATASLVPPDAVLAAAGGSGCCWSPGEAWGEGQLLGVHLRPCGVRGQLATPTCLWDTLRRPHLTQTAESPPACSCQIR